MRALLLPVKDLRHAKQRLSSALTPSQRIGLVQAMLSDTLRAVSGVREADAIFVVTNYEPVAQVAKAHGWEILREEQQISESVSVDAASRVCEQRGFTSVLRIPLDIPLVRASDIDDLLAAQCAAPTLVIVPSRDGTGTNAILRTPPSLFPSHFGNRSFAKHCEEARSATAEIIIQRNSRLEMDVDDESDLRALLQHDLSGTATGAWLAESGLISQFEGLPAPRATA